MRRFIFKEPNVSSGRDFFPPSGRAGSFNHLSLKMKRLIEFSFALLLMSKSRNQCLFLFGFLFIPPRSGFPAGVTYPTLRAVIF